MPSPLWTRLTPPGQDPAVYSVTEVHPTDPAHRVQVSEAAVADRKRLYGLATDDVAIEHIVAGEVLMALRAGPEAPPGGFDTARALLRPTVRQNLERIWGPDMKALRGLPQTDGELTQQRARIDATHGPRLTPTSYDDGGS